MNDDFSLSDETLADEQLRLATTRSLPSGVTLDAETAAARESFLALGAAVESASGPFDEAALVARLKHLCLEPTTVAARNPPRRDWWPLVLGGVLAASVALAIVRIAMVTQPTDTALAVATMPEQSKPVQSDLAGAKPAFAWNDPLDDEIALAAARIEQLASRQRGFDGSLLDMNERLEALSQELSGEAL